MAQDRHAPILAEVIGGGIALDANSSSAPNSAGEERAMRAAMADASVSAHDVTYLNAHGTASRLGDETEIAAIKNVFEAYAQTIWVNSTKSLIGHCLNAAGVVEAIATVVQMTEGFLHPNITLQEPIDSECRFVGRVAETAEIDVAMSNSFGFGGINSSIVLKRRL